MEHLYVRAVWATLAGFAAFFAVIFIPAWTLHYWQGWLLFVTLGTSTALATLYIAIHDSRLLESRLAMGPTAEKSRTQKIITAVGGPVFLAAFVGMVLDHRLAWSPPVPAWVSIAGNLVSALGLYIYYRVTKENSYAAATIGVVPGQTVCATGPYAVVRHPMYAGALLVFLGAPLALGSWWGLLVVPIAAAGFAWRLLDEENALKRDLQGYEEYMDKVQHRLIPYIW
jgi:protein-S-isoprenylcysteine O-methyltransferase Ste14